MRQAGPPWSSSSPDSYDHRPQSPRNSRPDSPPATSEAFRTTRHGQPYDARTAEAFRTARSEQPYDARTTEAFRTARSARPEGNPTTDGFRAARHARRRSRSLARWVIACAVVIGLAAVTAVVGFIARPSSGSPTDPSSASLAAPLPPPKATSTGTPTGKATSPAATSPGSPPAGLGSNWKLTFNAGFTGSKLDTSVWGTCYPWQSQAGCANFGNSDLEYQWYMPSQDQVSDGALHIVAQEEPTSGTDSSGDPENYSYRSGLVTTFPGYKFQYGYLQVVARIPNAQGTWTALWMAAANEQWPPEIDILEHWDASANYYEYYHPAGAPRENTVEKLGNLSTSYHTYGVYWTATKVIWYIDGHQVFETVRNVPQQPMYFLANVAVYKQAPSLSTPAALDIKSVSVWQQAGLSVSLRGKVADKPAGLWRQDRGSRPAPGGLADSASASGRGLAGQLARVVPVHDGDRDD